MDRVAAFFRSVPPLGWGLLAGGAVLGYYFLHKKKAATTTGAPATAAATPAASTPAGTDPYAQQLAYLTAQQQQQQNQQTASIVSAIQGLQPTTPTAPTAPTGPAAGAGYLAAPWNGVSLAGSGWGLPQGYYGFTDNSGQKWSYVYGSALQAIVNSDPNWTKDLAFMPTPGVAQPVGYGNIGTNISPQTPLYLKAS